MGDAPPVQDRPDASELAAAVAEFLTTIVRPAVPRELRFQVLVAANSCAQLAREAALAEAEPEHRAAREAQAQLAAAIRAGEHDERWDAVLAALRGEVRAKLAVAHPGYDDFADDGLS